GSVEQAGYVPEACQAQLGAVGIAKAKRPAVVEPTDDLRAVDVLEVCFEGLADRSLDKVARHSVRASLFAFVFKLELAGDRRERRVDITNPWHDLGLAGSKPAAFGV